MKLQNKFKNLHRPERALKCGVDLDEPMCKKFKSAEPEDISSSKLDEYKRHKKTLQNMFLSNKWVLSTVCDLVTQTFGQ